MFFSELLQSAKCEGDTTSLVVSEDWMQGRSVFGGLQGGLAVKAMRGLVEPELPLRTLQLTFLAPVPAGEVRARARILRRGKNTVHVETRLVDGEDVLALAVGVFGAGRQSAVQRIPEQPAFEPGEPVELPFIPGLTPNFTQHFSARWLRGGLPFTGSSLTDGVIEVGLKDSAQHASELHLIAIADLPPPVALSMLKEPAAGSSLTWMLEFLTDSFAQLPLAGWRIDAELVAGRDGYTSQSCRIWGPSGEPLALSRQSMVVFG